MAQAFTIQPHTTADKRFDIEGPHDLRLMVDFDDVDHETVEKTVVALVEVLNRFNWDNPR